MRQSKLKLINKTYSVKVNEYASKGNISLKCLCLSCQLGSTLKGKNLPLWLYPFPLNVLKLLLWELDYKDMCWDLHEILMAPTLLNRHRLVGIFSGRITLKPSFLGHSSNLSNIFGNMFAQVYFFSSSCYSFLHYRWHGTNFRMHLQYSSKSSQTFNKPPTKIQQCMKTVCIQIL